MTQSTKQLDKDLCWDDLSIQPYNQTHILVLVSDDPEHRIRLYQILNTYHYSFVFSIEPDKTYEFHLQFLRMEFAKSFKTGLTEKKYPPLKLLREGQVKYITTGHWNGIKTECDHLEPIPVFCIQRSSKPINVPESSETIKPRSPGSN